MNDCINGVEYVGIIENGIVDVYSMGLDGKEIKLSSLYKNEAFGICNLFYKSEISTILKAKTDCEIVLIQKKELAELIMTDEEVLSNYLSLCNKKIQFLLDRIENLNVQSSKDKLIKYLFNHSDANGCVNCKCSREDMACELGFSRATLFREMSKLKKSNIISVKSGKIYIK